MQVEKSLNGYTVRSEFDIEGLAVIFTSRKCGKSIVTAVATCLRDGAVVRAVPILHQTLDVFPAQRVGAKVIQKRHSEALLNNLESVRTKVRLLVHQTPSFQPHTQGLT